MSDLDPPVQDLCPSELGLDVHPLCPAMDPHVILERTTVVALFPAAVLQHLVRNIHNIISSLKWLVERLQLRGKTV